MADEEDDGAVYEVPSYGDNIAQRAQAFEYLARSLERVSDQRTKELGHAMLKAIIEKVQDKPLRGLRSVEANDG